MLKHSEDTGVSELGDIVRTTTYRNVPTRSCSRCPMLLVEVGGVDGHCALYGEQLIRGEPPPRWCRVVEVTVTEKFEGKQE